MASFNLIFPRNILHGFSIYFPTQFFRSLKIRKLSGKILLNRTAHQIDRKEIKRKFPMKHQESKKNEP
jgi:hypothetical protein